MTSLRGRGCGGSVAPRGFLGDVVECCVVDCVADCVADCVVDCAVECAVRIGVGVSSPGQRPAALSPSHTPHPMIAIDIRIDAAAKRR